MNKLTKNRIGFGGKFGVMIVAAVLVFVAALILCLVLLVGKEDAVRIGVIVPLSGSASLLVDLRDSIVLAVDEVNSWGGINGRKIELIIEDSMSNPEKAEEIFRKMETEYHPALYISAMSSVSMALAPLAEENKVALVGLVVSSPELTKQMEWVFRYYTSAEIEARVAMDILRNLKVRKLGILYQRDEYGISVFEFLRSGFEAVGRNIRVESFEPEESDYRNQIAKLKDTEGIYIVGFAKPKGQAIKQLRKENYNGFIIGDSGVANLKTAPEVNGVYMAAPAIYNPNYLFAREAAKKYEARYGKPFDHQAATGYDFVKLLAGLLRDMEISRESVRDVLAAGFTYPGIFGELHVKQGEHDVIFPLYPAQIVDGEVRYLQ